MFSSMNIIHLNVQKLYFIIKKANYYLLPFLVISLIINYFNFFNPISLFYLLLKNIVKIDDMITKLQIILDGVIFVLLLSLTGCNDLKSSRHRADGPISADCVDEELVK